MIEGADCKLVRPLFLDWFADYKGLLVEKSVFLILQKYLLFPNSRSREESALYVEGWEDGHRHGSLSKLKKETP